MTLVDYLRGAAPPEGWVLTPLSSLTREVKRPNHGAKETNLLSLSYGQVVRKDISANGGLLPESFSGYQILEPGEIVMRLIDLQNDQRSLRTGLVPMRGIITSAYLALHPVACDSRYLAQVLHGYDISKTYYALGGGLRQSLTFSDLKRLPIPLPPLEEQRRIADFLDDQTTRINNIIAARQRQRILLSEAEWSDVVARVAASETGEDSRSPWQGTVWPVVPLGRFARKQDRPLEGPSEVVTAFRDGFVGRRSRRRNDGFTFSEKEAGYQGVRSGDLVFHGLDGFAGAIGVSVDDGRCSPVYHVLTFEDDDPAYVSLALRVAAFTGLLEIQVPSTRQRAVDFRNWSTLAMVRIPRPPKTDQRRIANGLRNDAETRHRGLRLLTRSIDSLNEFRQSLISSAVSGEFDVATADGSQVRV